MFPIKVDPKWYDNYWLSDQPRSKRRAFSKMAALLAAMVILLAGGGLKLIY
jgi:hypothetical protein